MSKRVFSIRLVRGARTQEAWGLSMSDSSPVNTTRGTDWGALPVSARGLLLTVYFTTGAALLALISFWTNAGWPLRFGMLAIWLVPEALVFFGRQDLRSYLPGPLLYGFSLFLGMILGVFAEKVAVGGGANPALAKWLFVGMGAAIGTVVVWLAFRRVMATPGKLSSGGRVERH